MDDSYKHKGLRKKLVDQIRHKGIKNESVLDAINEVPRHFFFESSFQSFAYDDKPFPIGAGQTISQPYTVAFQTELLEIKKGDKVLEIGTGSGYQACILAKMGAKVYSIERIKSLYIKAKELLPRLNCNQIKLYYGDGYKGLPAFAPFDKILVTAAAPFIPDALLEQLRPGGCLVIPVGADDVQVMKRIVKSDDQQYNTEEHGLFRFVPLLNEKEKN